MTTINDGDVDQAATNVSAVSQGAGMSQGTQGSSAVWKWKQAGAFLEYTLKAVTAGTYTVNFVYFAAQEGGSADVLLNGTNVGKVTFGTTAKVGGYGGIPNGLSRGPGTAMSLVAGTNKVRIAFTSRSAPIDVFGLQVNFLVKRCLTRPDPTLVDANSLAGRRAFRLLSNPLHPQLSIVELSEVILPRGVFRRDREGRKLRAHHEVRGRGHRVLGRAFPRQRRAAGGASLPPGAGVTGAKTIQLPCGVSRLSIRNANYLTGGAYCAYGAQYGQVELKPLP